jgi:cell division protein FtsB
MTRRNAGSRGPKRRSNLVAGALVVGGVVFGLWGGEYSTADWWTLRRQVAHERDVIEQLETEVDSLTPMADALENDPATQEWVAREKFGMVRPGEVMYQVEVER